MTELICAHCEEVIDQSEAHVTHVDGTAWHSRDDQDCYAVREQEGD